TVTAIISTGSNLPDLGPGKPKTLIQQEPDTIIDPNSGIAYYCSNKTYSMTNIFDQTIAINPNSGTLFPGALVQGKYVRNGELNSIGSFPRTQIKLTMDGYGQSAIVNDPDNASVDAAVNKMVSENTASTIANIDYQLSEYQTKEQSLLELGIDYRWDKGSIGTKFNNGKTLSKNSIMLKFTQAYYTISMEQPGSGRALFKDNFSEEGLKDKISSDNPLCYLSSVTYGRIILVQVTSSSTLDAMKAAINGSLGKVSGSISYSTNTLLEDAEYKIKIIGGSAQDALEAVTADNKMQGIRDLLNSGANFSSSSRGFPISYVVRHAKDNSIVKLGNALEFSVNDDCYFSPSAFQRFQISFDYFKVIADCDDGIFTNTGEGEFVYKFQLFSDGQLVKTIPATGEGTFNLSDDGIFNMNAGPYEFNVPKQNGKQFVIKGSLKEKDDSGTNTTTLNWPDIEFSYPFTDVKTTPTAFYQPLFQSSSCNAEFYFTVKKI
ncbi:MAG TPA: thiol-activated cytolysin family protein, partial [Saprospiraceae bacterium]|nr:thiol-activated cytolysin family protein [Saprospiraceae bacterium]